MTTPVGPRVDGSSVTLLIDLVTNTLDPGYAEAARRAPRSTGRRRRRIEQALVALGCVLTGFTLAVAYVSTHQAAPETAKVHADLVSRARAAQSGADGLQKTAQRLTTKIDALRNQALSGAGGLRGQLQNIQLLAGTVAVAGPGIVVTLSNPPTAAPSTAAGRAGSTPIGATQLLTDRDVRSVVNQLWAAGAEAISVNDIRLTPTAAIRFAGEAVLVDFEPINPPYIVRAIGNEDLLDTGFAASDVASRYQTLASVNGIGFSFDERSKLDLPAGTVSNPTYAHAIGTTSSSGSPTPAAPSTGASK
jgi:uncharacterized protein YlxW (UPF0749 family)